MSKSRGVVTLDTLVREADTGDILLFGGTGIFATIEKLVTDGEFSHVAVVIVSGDLQPFINNMREKHGLPPLGADVRLIFESTRDNDEPNVLTGEHKDGPRLVNASTYIPRYYQEGGPHTVIVYRSLVMDTLWKAKVHGKEAHARNIEFVSGAVKKTYEQQLVHLAEAYMRGAILPHVSLAGERSYPLGSDSSSYFCSELVAAWYSNVLKIPLLRRQEFYIPKDFSGASPAIAPLGKRGFPAPGREELVRGGPIIEEVEEPEPTVAPSSDPFFAEWDL